MSRLSKHDGSNAVRSAALFLAGVAFPLCLIGMDRMIFRGSVAPSIEGMQITTSVAFVPALLCIVLRSRSNMWSARHNSWGQIHPFKALFLYLAGILPVAVVHLQTLPRIEKYALIPTAICVVFCLLVIRTSRP